ncbi:nicotinate (nicotinamide) nucleotide adenylyltransferase [Rhodoferax sp. OV413]|uniref:nicotinate (nicotinamide) nucleotide adenylyltransferase n=1 Tax=Rhodoferax sp. OV413 TaxID=1855285 RepID=UPI0025F848AE|nr:nicotinate (nicotinamide) nucleotide adenylyltransferase [Rhodoferax sp. OV413]
MSGAGQLLRIGVFGGAFDPPHIGHLGLARSAIAQLGLDRLLVIPTGFAWHKNFALSGAEHRLAMAALAFTGLPQAQVDARETLRSGPSYTLDTLRELRAENREAQLYLLIGEDQARALHTWHDWQEIPELAIICVAARADSTSESAQNRVENADRFDALRAELPGLTVLNMPAMPISATHIRQRVASGESIAPLVFEPVARYIDQHHLYRSN